MSDIWTAIGKKDIQSLRFLISSEPTLIEVLNEWGISPLILATDWDNTEAIKFLLEFGANANRAVNITSPISSRVQTGVVPLMFVKSCKAIDLLINAGANVNETDSRGRSVLFVLSSPYQKIELLNYLYSKGAKLKREEIQTLLDWVIGELEYRKESVHLNNNLARVEQLEKMLHWCKNYV